MATIAYGYLRVSSSGQVNRFGFDRQKEVIAEYANNNNCNIAKFYYEKGVSGTLNETDRPAFQDMVGDILKNGVDTVIIEGLDRLARDKAKIIYGKCEGAKRYGELCEVERAVKRRIRSMRRLHPKTDKPTMTYAAIADRLNGEGIGTKRGGKWSAAQVYQVWCVK